VNSCSMARRQFGSLSAARTDNGVGESDDVVTVRAYLGLGLLIPARDQVSKWYGVAVVLLAQQLVADQVRCLAR
jgi:hypothetical protein